MPSLGLYRGLVNQSSHRVLSKFRRSRSLDSDYPLALVAFDFNDGVGPKAPGLEDPVATVPTEDPD